jgi:hypothetical protein
MPEAARARLARPHAGTALSPRNQDRIRNAPLVGEELFPDSGFVVGVEEGAGKGRPRKLLSF